MILMLQSVYKKTNIAHVKEDCKIVENNCNLLLYLIHDILDYSQILKSELRVVQQTFHINHVLQEMEVQFRP